MPLRCSQGLHKTLYIPAYTVFAGYIAHSAPISICPGRPNGRSSWKSWLTRPQLYFTCCLRPRDGGSPTGRRPYGKDDIQVQLMLYSTFEMLDLPGSGPTETHRIVSGVVLALLRDSKARNESGLTRKDIHNYGSPENMIRYPKVSWLVLRYSKYKYLSWNLKR